MLYTAPTIQAMTTTHPVQTGKQYRRVIFGLFAIGIVSLLGGLFLDQSLAGLVIYAVTVLGGVGLTFFVQFGSPAKLQDEREYKLGRRASHITFQLFGYLGLFSFVALFLLDAIGQYALTTRTTTLLYAYAVISLTWGGIYTVLRFRS